MYFAIILYKELNFGSGNEGYGKVYLILHTMKRTSFPFILSLLLLLGCGPSKQELKEEQVRQARLEKAAYEAAFKVAVMPTLDCLPMFLLKDSLLYDSARIDVQLKLFNAQMDCDTAMIGRSVQAAVSDLVRTERLKRRRVPITYMTGTGATWQLIANRKSEILKLQDLSDKIVAMTRYSITDLLTDKIIKDAKPKHQVFRAQINDVFIRMKMLQNNELDAFWFAEPQATQARLAGNKVLYDSKENAFRPGVVAFVEKGNRIAQQNAMMEAYNRAVDSINKNGVKRYSALIKKYMKADDATIAALPELKYEKVQAPRPSDVLEAKYYLERFKQKKR